MEQVEQAAQAVPDRGAATATLTLARVHHHIANELACITQRLVRLEEQAAINERELATLRKRCASSDSMQCVHRLRRRWQNHVEIMLMGRGPEHGDIALHVACRDALPSAYPTDELSLGWWLLAPGDEEDFEDTINVYLCQHYGIGTFAFDFTDEHGYVVTLLSPE